MNYIMQLKGFKIRRLSNAISANSICLYFILLEYSNDIGFPEWFTAPNSTIQGLCGMNKNALCRSRNELQQKGFIKYKNGRGNQAGKYNIIDLTAGFATQTERKPNANRTQTATQTEPLYKLNKTTPPIVPPTGTGNAVEKSKTASELQSLVLKLTPNTKLQTAMLGWIDMRIKKGKKHIPTGKAVELAYNRVKDWCGSLDDACKCFEESTLRNWDGVFNPQGNGG
jgi:hypothetical protein